MAWIADKLFGSSGSASYKYTEGDEYPDYTNIPRRTTSDGWTGPNIFQVRLQLWVHPDVSGTGFEFAIGTRTQKLQDMCGRIREEMKGVRITTPTTGHHTLPTSRHTTLIMALRTRSMSGRPATRMTGRSTTTREFRIRRMQSPRIAPLLWRWPKKRVSVGAMIWI